MSFELLTTTTTTTTTTLNGKIHQVWQGKATDH